MSNAPRLIRMLVLFLSVILMLLLASIAVAQENTSASDESVAGDAATTNSLTVVDQSLGEGDTVVVSQVSVTDPSWIVIQRASTDVIGQVVGKTAVPAGISTDVVVVLSKEVPVGAELLAALHVDAGVEGVYEFPVGPDRAVLQDDEPVSVAFSIAEVEEMADEESLPSEEVVLTEEEPAAEEEASTEEAATTEEEPAVEEEASTEEVVLTEEEPAAEEEASTEEAATTEEEPAVEEEASTEEEPAAEQSTEAEEVPGNILDIAGGTEGIKTFLEAVRSSDLLDTLRMEGLYTVFAPNDEAFSGLPEGALDELLSDPEGTLSPALRYHVVQGELPSSAIVDGASVDTLQGEPLQFSVDGDSIMVNDAKIVEADIEAVNGIIHIIDGVLLPPTATEMTPGEVESGEDMAAGTETKEPREMPATGGASSTMVIFVIMGIVSLGWAGNIVVTRRRQLSQTAHAENIA